MHTSKIYQDKNRNRSLPIPILYSEVVVIFQFENQQQLLHQLQPSELNKNHSHIKDDCEQRRLFTSNSSYTTLLCFKNSFTITHGGQSGCV